MSKMIILVVLAVLCVMVGSPRSRAHVDAQQSQTPLPIRIGELPRMTLYNANRMGELSCPSDHVLVVQVISSYRAWVSCPPSYFIAPVENTPAPVSPLVTPAALSAARMK